MEISKGAFLPFNPSIEEEMTAEELKLGPYTIQLLKLLLDDDDEADTVLN